MKHLFYCAFIFLLTAAHAAQAAPSVSSAEKRIFEELNTERVSHGLTALQWDDHAAGAARAHAQLLAENGTLSHQFPGENSLPERLAPPARALPFPQRMWPAPSLLKTSIRRSWPLPGIAPTS